MITDGEIENLLGIQWKAHGYDLDGFDCWGLVNYIYVLFLDIQLPHYLDIDREKLLEYHRKIKSEIDSKWDLLEKPVDFCAVGMSSNKKAITHVGVYIERHNSILHCYSGAGVVFEKLPAIKRKFNTVKFYGLRN